MAKKPSAPPPRPKLKGDKPPSAPPKRPNKKIASEEDAAAVRRGNRASKYAAEEYRDFVENKKAGGMVKKKAMGGMMKKKAYGGKVKKMAMGGKTRGCGAATKGTKYSRAG